MANNRGLVILPSFFAVIDSKSDAERLALYDALTRYYFNGEYPSNLAPQLMDLFTLMRPNIDSSRAKYDACIENGKKGGRPPDEDRKTKAKNKVKKPNEKTRQKNHDKDMDKDIDMDTSSPSGKEVIQSFEDNPNDVF